MKWIVLAATVAFGAALVPAGSAQAAGCLKGAVVGGVAGHYLGHHGFLGATAGCLISRHEANKQARPHNNAGRQYYATYR